ncbi:MAG: YraN family protein [Candidatus Bacteroides intestinipullorum]|uniref:UPF0102 protein H9791_11050 n=1 Tax=Candidatus Bacteroides intestinipullorum TaxID=2838471 RepID=A0A9E2NPL3_9BACE|nr:YraN family protein [Candidatus Bacteroides intestinipullorum]
MTDPHLLGKAGEDAAADYLEEKGYTILDRNWRKNRLELDIIATKGDIIAFVEVKTRKNTDFREPHEAVDWKKIRHIVVAADAYIKLHAIDLKIRFDIIDVVGDVGQFQITQIEDAFNSPIFH